LLVLAINMLPAPQKDLLEQSEQLCNYLRLQQRPDGSLRCADLVFDAAPSLAMEEASACHAGQALYGLMASYRHRPEAWKLDVVRKAIAFYTPAWTAHRSLAMAPWHCAAYATAFEVTKDKTFADAVFVMADWLGGLQYDRLDPRHPEWWGGFQTVSEGKPAGGAPDVGSATAAECLAEACRVARLAPDAARADRYEASLDLSLQFLSRLQYTPGNTRHFADWYRPKLLGGFYASPTDGTLRLDATQHVVCALAGYCAYVSAPIQQHARAIP
jgi:hypothetical protein